MTGFCLSSEEDEARQRLPCCLTRVTWHRAERKPPTQAQLLPTTLLTLHAASWQAREQQVSAPLHCPSQSSSAPSTARECSGRCPLTCPNPPSATRHFFPFTWLQEGSSVLVLSDFLLFFSPPLSFLQCPGFQAHG